MAAALRNILLLASFTSYLLVPSIAVYVPSEAHDHDHSVPFHVDGAWSQPDDHPVHALFKRDAPTTDGVTYAQVGSAAWTAAYPPAKPDTTKLPQAWVDALNAATAAGKIPNIPVAKLVNGNPTYPAGSDPSSATVCSTTVQCKLNPDVVWNAPDGVFASSFDDGPLPPATKLYAFLQQNNVHTTHFFIGENILQNPNVFLEAFNNGDDLAVHTWTHPYMTTLSNLDVLGELGWTMEIIHNSSGGRVPKFWRPPYGDSDNRVIAIAKEVFGLTTVVWNNDTDDWAIVEGGQTSAKVEQLMTQWLTGPKHPGLVILEHELYDQTVQAFITAFPLIKSNGWQFMSLAQMNSSSPYQNTASATGPVTPDPDVIVNANLSVPPTSSASPTLNSTSAAPTSTSGSTSGSSSSNKPAATGGSAQQNANAAFSIFDSAYLQFKSVVAACATVALSFVAFS
ncbi:hypothetical protein C8Q75DRAFT_729533 [Abortiporus biennis]|nr:hypothetical protein C8Q75DRAFT_729533 [Abortiporus biennis]